MTVLGRTKIHSQPCVASLHDIGPGGTVRLPEVDDGGVVSASFLRRLNDNDNKKKVAKLVLLILTYLCIPFTPLLRCVVAVKSKIPKATQSRYL